MTEDNITKAIESTFPSDDYSLKVNDTSDEFFSKFLGRLVPDAVLYYNGKEVAVIEYKNVTAYNTFYLNTCYANVRNYCRESKVPYGLIYRSDHTVYLLSEANGFVLGDAIQAKSALSEIFDRMSLITEIDPSKLEDEFYERMKKTCAATPYISKELLDRVKEITKDQMDWGNIKSNATTVTLPKSFVSVLFKAILGTYKYPYICRYTTRSSLKRIIDDKKQSLCSIVGMNDKSECYYAANYISRDNQHSLSSLSKYEIAKLNSYYITSCTSMENSEIDMSDNLGMWRMYADDCKGVCIVFDIDWKLLDSKNYILAPISYQQCVREKVNPDYDPETGETTYEVENRLVHPELDFVRGLLYCKVGGYSYKMEGLEFWLHFFKSYEYRDEREVRLMFEGDGSEDKKWIETNDIYCPVVERSIADITQVKDKDKYADNEFPFILKEVKLGPKFAEQRVNVAQIQTMIDQSGIKTVSGFVCTPSTIDNYR